MSLAAAIRTHTVRIPPAGLEGDLAIPEDATGLVLFAHGSGSSRHSARNQFVAGVLQQGGLATLLFDLLSPGEEAVDMRDGSLRFDIELLAGRLVSATDWVGGYSETRDLRPAYFGASTGGAAALAAAALRREVTAVVSRGGRPDLAIDALSRVQAPTLLIVGSRDLPVLDMNRAALAKMTAAARLEIVPGATHLFEEPGALDQVARLARDWFVTHSEAGL